MLRRVDCPSIIVQYNNFLAYWNGIPVILMLQLSALISKPPAVPFRTRP